MSYNVTISIFWYVSGHGKVTSFQVPGSNTGTGFGFNENNHIVNIMSLTDPRFFSEASPINSFPAIETLFQSFDTDLGFNQCNKNYDNIVDSLLSYENQCHNPHYIDPAVSTLIPPAASQGRFPQTIFRVFPDNWCPWNKVFSGYKYDSNEGINEFREALESNFELTLGGQTKVMDSTYDPACNYKNAATRAMFLNVEENRNGTITITNEYIGADGYGVLIPNYTMTLAELAQNCMGEATRVKPINPRWRGANITYRTFIYDSTCCSYDGDVTDDRIQKAIDKSNRLLPEGLQRGGQKTNYSMVGGAGERTYYDPFDDTLDNDNKITFIENTDILPYYLINEQCQINGGGKNIGRKKYRKSIKYRKYKKGKSYNKKGKSRKYRK